MAGVGPGQVVLLPGRTRRRPWSPGPGRGTRVSSWLTRRSTSPGDGSSNAYARTALRTWPMIVAARRSCPVTSPTASANRPSGSAERVEPVAADVDPLDHRQVRGDESRLRRPGRPSAASPARTSAAPGARPPAGAGRSADRIAASAARSWARWAVTSCRSPTAAPAGRPRRGSTSPVPYTSRTVPSGRTSRNSSANGALAVAQPRGTRRAIRVGVDRVHGQLAGPGEERHRVADDRPAICAEPVISPVARSSSQLPMPGQPLGLLQLDGELRRGPQRLRLGLQPGEPVLLGDVHDDQRDGRRGSRRRCAPGSSSRSRSSRRHPDRHVGRGCAVARCLHLGGHRAHHRRQAVGLGERACRPGAGRRRRPAAGTPG